MDLKLPSAINRARSVAPICRLFSGAFRSQRSDQRMHGRKDNSVDSSDSLTSISSNGVQGRMSWKETGYNKPKSYKNSDNIDKELEVLAKELLPRVLKMPFTVEQWMAAINSVCDQYPTESSADDYSEEDRYQRKRVSCLDRPKLPMIGLSSMEKRLRDPEAKLHPKETPPPPQQTITLRAPDPMNLPIVWVPKLPPQTTKLLQSMPCEIFQDIHRTCQQTPDRPQRTKYTSPRKKLPSKKSLNKPEPKPKPTPRPRSRRKKRRPCCCCCRMTRQELECSGSAPAGKAYKAPPKPASAPPPEKPKAKSKPAPKPKPKPQPKAKPAPKAEPEPEKPTEEAPPKVEVKVEDPKPVAKPSKTGSDSSSEEDSSGADTPPTAPGPTAPPAAGKDYMADLFASKPAGGGGSYAPSGASSPKPPGGADWMKDFGGASSPKPPASTGADWLTGAPAASPAAPTSDWLSGSTTPKPAGPDWLS